jgi:tRNA (cmo5U34)-methyltransferase
MEATPQDAQGVRRRRREDWNDDEYVSSWLEGQPAREAERHKQFVTIRAFMPKTPDDEFRYVNLGAGPGNLDEVLLAHFPRAQATLVDTSNVMLETARERLARYEGRVETVKVDLTDPAWAQAVNGPFGFAVSVIALHNLGEPRFYRSVYQETFKLLGSGGILLNLDYVRPPRTSMALLGSWAVRDSEAALIGNAGGGSAQGSMLEQLTWLNEAGFATYDCVWKDNNTVLFCGIKDELQMPESFLQEREARRRSRL